MSLSGCYTNNGMLIHCDEYLDWEEESEFDLVHYGVLGMKWGIRRYQPYSYTKGRTKGNDSAAKRFVRGLGDSVRNAKAKRKQRAANKYKVQKAKVQEKIKKELEKKAVLDEKEKLREVKNSIKQTKVNARQEEKNKAKAEREARIKEKLEIRQKRNDAKAAKQEAKNAKKEAKLQKKVERANKKLLKQYAKAARKTNREMRKGRLDAPNTTNRADIPKRDLKKMSDAEITSRTERLKLEKTLQETARDVNRSQAKKFVDAVMSDAGKKVAIAAVTGAGIYATKKLVGQAAGAAAEKYAKTHGVTDPADIKKMAMEAAKSASDLVKVYEKK